jgi:hypothetical protein
MMVLGGTVKIIRIQLVKVRTTSSLWGFTLGKLGDQYTEEITVTYQPDDSSFQIMKNNTLADTTAVFLEFIFTPQIQTITRKPATSILTAIAKIGGLLALLRFSLLLQLWHEKLFVAHMNQSLYKK